MVETREKCRRAKFCLDSKDRLIYRRWVKVQELKNRKWITVERKVVDVTPESLGYVKQITDHVVLKKEISSKESYTGFDVVLFLKKIKYTVRDDKPYAYLIKTVNKQTSKICIKNFDTGITGFVGTKSDSLVIVDASEPKPVTKEKVMHMYELGQISEIYSGSEKINGETVYKKSVIAQK